jgi:hypothetical protein|tara:strand:- start:4980 stop:6731 length:1752 start_codon:yes stop_codon:yes gene_type:complete
MAKQVKIDIVARDKTKRAIESSKSNLGSLKKFALAASAAIATIGAGRAITGLVNVGKEMESLQIRFKLLFGSAEEGAKAFDTLSDFAAKVPFSLGDIAAASGNLAVVAKDAKELNKILEITGNVAGATGLDFQTTASQIQRAFSGGIASADIFREKGIRDMLDFSAGVKVSVEETREAFARVFAGNGEFAKTTEELANTLEGTLSMIGDKFLNFQLAINESFFAELKSQFGDLNDFLDLNQAEIEDFGKDIGVVLAGSLVTLAGAVKTVKDNFAEFEAALGAVLLVAGGFFKIIAGGVLVLDSFNRKQKELIEMTEEYNRVMSSVDYDDAIMRIARLNEAQALNQESLITSIRQSGEYAESLNKIAEATNSVSEATNNTTSSIEGLTFAQQKVVQGFEDQKASSREAHKVEKEGVKSRKEGLAETGEALKKFAAEGAKRSKKMFRLQQGVQIAEAIMNTYAGATKALATLPPPFSFAVAALTVATGLAQVANIRSQQPPAMFGGSRQQGTPFLVGERGPELFTPATAGTVTPNHQLPSGGNTVNFNITTVDAQSFGALLDTRRGQIVNMINTALNNKGQAALV